MLHCLILVPEGLEADLAVQPVLRLLQEVQARRLGSLSGCWWPKFPAKRILIRIKVPAAILFYFTSIKMAQLYLKTIFELTSFSVASSPQPSSEASLRPLA